MTSQAHQRPTHLALFAMVFGPAPLSCVIADTDSWMVSASAQSVPSNSNATTNPVVTVAVLTGNSTPTALTRNVSSIASSYVVYNAVYSANGNTSHNTSVNTLIEVERRGADRTTQVPAVTGSTIDLSTHCTEARTPRTACPAFTRRPLSTMTSTTNTPLRRAPGDSRSLH